MTELPDVDVIRRAWSKETSANPAEWSKTNPARGQCAVTALVVQAVSEGKLIRTTVTLPDGTTESHYANLVGHGVIIDLTDEQFPAGSTFAAWEERDRDYVLSFPDTVRRYNVLTRRLNEVRTIEVVKDHGHPL
jgi:hypothetical protein